MDNVISAKSTEKLIERYLQSLRGVITERSDIQEGLIHTRKQLLNLSSRYNRNVLYHLCYHFICALFGKLNFRQLNPSKKEVSVPARFEAVNTPSTVKLSSTFEGYFVGQLMAEIDLAPLERSESAYTGLSTFVSLPHSLVQNWFMITKQEKLTWRPALTYLAACIASRRHGGATEKQISSYIGFTQKTVHSHISKLISIHLLRAKEVLREDNSVELITFNLPAYDNRATSFPSFGEPIKDHLPWFAELNPFTGQTELTWAPFAPWVPKNRKSPIIQILYDRLDAHERSLEAMLVAAACLSRTQINDWLREVHGKHYGTLIKAMEMHFFAQIKERFSFPERKHRHYLQIARALPLVMYSARRAFQVDPGHMMRTAKMTHTEIKLAWQDYVVVWKNLQIQAGFKGLTEELQWDSKYFLTCFLRNKPFSHWSKRYPEILPRIPLSHSIMSNDIKWVTITEKMFNLKFMENLADRSDLASALARVMRLFSDRKLLRRLRLDTYAKNEMTPRGITKTLDNASHRMYTVEASRQTISKRLRPIFKAKPGFQFIMFDIKQNDLQLWKALRSLHAQEKAEEPESIIFEDISKKLNLPRDTVKYATYSFFYGASKTRITTEFGLSQQEWLTLGKMLFSRFKPMKKAIIAHTKSKRFTPPTPLGYRIPVNRKDYRAPSLYVQAVGAEILREWILELHKKDLSQYIVNLIHDEIIMEVPISINLYHLTDDVQHCLDRAKDSLLPNADLRIRAKAARRWDSDVSAVIRE